jgi:hypothetical protein
MTWWVAGAVVGSSLIGANAASDAAETQAGAARDAAALSNEQFKQTREDQAPYREVGYRALGTLERTAGNVPSAFSYDNKAMPAAFSYDNKGMPAAFSFSNQAMYNDPGYGFRLSEGQKALDRSAAARGGLISGGALKAATRFGQDMGSQEYMNAFNRALTGYNTDINRENQLYNRALTGYNADVNRENQLYGRALTGYNTGVASENQLYNRQANLAGIGQTSTNLVGQAGAANAANVGNLMTSGAAAQAAGQVGQANAVNQGVSSYLNYNQGNNLLNALNTNRYGTNYGQFTPGSNAFVGPMQG